MILLMSLQRNVKPLGFFRNTMQVPNHRNNHREYRVMAPIHPETPHLLHRSWVSPPGNQEECLAHGEHCCVVNDSLQGKL